MDKGEKTTTSKEPVLLQGDFLTELEAQVLTEVKAAVKAAGFDDSGVKVDHPQDLRFGDFTSNIAMILFAKGVEKYKSPVELGEEIKAFLKVEESRLIEKVEVAMPGFLNLWVKKEVLVSQLRRVIKEKENYGKTEFLKGKKILLEHTSPDPIKTIHIGHLRNNFLGMAMSRIFQSQGAQVTLDCINNDRGTHVCRAMFGYLVLGRKSLGIGKEELLGFKVTDEKVKEVAFQAKWESLLESWLATPDEWLKPEDLGLKSDHLDLIFYSLGDRAERLVEGVKEQVREMLRAWEEEQGKVRALWQQIIDWSLSGYEVTYKRIGSRHDKVWHESELYKEGKEMVGEGLKKGVFKESKGAVVTDLSAFKLPDTVMIKADGSALYITFDINLTKKKREQFPSDLYVWDIGNDQLLYLQQQFAICEQLGIGKRGDYYHLNYGYVYLEKGQKMSSRKGTVVKADDLLDLLKGKALEVMKGAKRQEKFKPEEMEVVAEKVGLAAIKYGLLKTTRETDIYFDAEKSVNLAGNSGPYLQYTFARCQSVLKKAIEGKVIFSLSDYDLFRGELVGGGGGRPPLMPPVGPGGAVPPKMEEAGEEPKKELVLEEEEDQLLRTIYRYPEVLVEATRRLEPALVAGFLYDLASKYNLFYNKYSILGTEKERVDKDTSYLRLALTAGVTQVLGNGLVLLGIESLERM